VYSTLRWISSSVGNIYRKTNFLSKSVRYCWTLLMMCLIKITLMIVFRCRSCSNRNCEGNGKSYIGTSTFARKYSTGDQRKIWSDRESLPKALQLCSQYIVKTFSQKLTSNCHYLLTWMTFWTSSCLLWNCQFFI